MRRMCMIGRNEEAENEGSSLVAENIAMYRLI